MIGSSDRAKSNGIVFHILENGSVQIFSANGASLTEEIEFSASKNVILQGKSSKYASKQKNDLGFVIFSYFLPYIGPIGVTEKTFSF